jgi:hypothetical protein
MLRNLAKISVLGLVIMGCQSQKNSVSLTESTSSGKIILTLPSKALLPSAIAQNLSDYRLIIESGPASSAFDGIKETQEKKSASSTINGVAPCTSKVDHEIKKVGSYQEGEIEISNEILRKDCRYHIVLSLGIADPQKKMFEDSMSFFGELFTTTGTYRVNEIKLKMLSNEKKKDLDNIVFDDAVLSFKIEE